MGLPPPGTVLQTLDMVPLLPSTLLSLTRSLLPTTASLPRLTLVVSTWTCQRSSSCCPSSSLSSLPSSLPSSSLHSSASSSTPRSDFWEAFWAPLAGSRVVSSTSSSTPSDCNSAPPPLPPLPSPAGVLPQGSP